MKSKLLNLLSSIHASFWYYPLLMSIIVTLLSIITLHLDAWIQPKWFEILWFHNPEGARALLTIIASSMVTVISVTFSMTIIAVSFAGSHIGPRLITNFMRDRTNQITLGVFVATFLFCILILRSVVGTNTDDLTFVPQISLFMAFILTLCSIVVLIYFFHHIPESINMSNVIARVGNELYRQIDTLFPFNIGKERDQTATGIPETFQKYQKTITADQYGYIRVLDGDTLISLAKNYNVIIQLKEPVGKFITPHTDLLHIYSSESIPDSLDKECLNTFAYGYQRNQEQDTIFLIHQLIEIIGRALSPGINDPYSAMTAMNWLQLSLEKISCQKQASPYRYDDDDHLKLIVPVLSFSDFCEIIFCGIQAYVCRERNSCFHMMRMMVNLHDNLNNNEHKITLASHANELKKAALECLPVEADRRAIEHLYLTYFKL